METGAQQAIDIQPGPSSSYYSSFPTLDSRRRLVDLGLVLLIAIIPLIATALYALYVPIVGTSSNTNMRFVSGLVHEIGALTLLACLLSRQNRSIKEIGLGFRWTDILKAIGLFIIAMIAYLLSYSVINASYHSWTREYIHFRDPAIIFGKPSAVLLFLYILAAPLFEEIIVRGYLMTELSGFSCPMWLAAMASVVLQTSYHLYYGFAGALLLGSGFAVLAIYFARSKRLMPVILAHFLWDLTASVRYWHR